MDDGDFKTDLGVQSRLHRRQLMSAVTKLRDTVAAAGKRGQRSRDLAYSRARGMPVAGGLT
jgi:hypothetical protein